MIRRGLTGFVLLLVLLAALGVFRERLGVAPFYLILLSTFFFWAAQATSWNVLSGYSGYFSFGQGAFVGVGVYSTAVLSGRHGWSFYATLPVAAVLGTLLALGIGAIAFRLGSFRGETFALLTLAVPFILAAAARLSDRIDGGQGMVVPVPEAPGPLGFQEFRYLVNLVIAVAAVAAGYAIWHSRFGWALAAVRDAEDVAEGLGVATFRWKMLAIAASGTIGSLAGSAYALQIGFVSVEAVFELTIPLFVIVMCVLGGRTHWLGPVIGAGVIVLMRDRLSGTPLERWELIVFGGLLAVMVIVAPQGLRAQLRTRPWASLGAGAATIAVLALTRVWGQELDWLAAGLVAAAVTSFLPRPGSRSARTASPAPAPGAVSDPTAAGAPAPAARAPEPTPQATDPTPQATDPTSQAPAGTTPAAEAPVAPATPSGTTLAGEPAVMVECDHLTRHYGGVHALEGLTLRIRRGELVGLVGPNGSGKTTLVNLLSGAVRPTRGEIRVAGQEISGLAPHLVAHAGIARTYQIPRPFASMTVRDNVAVAVMFGRRPRSLGRARVEADRFLEQVGLAELGSAYPSEVNLHQRQLLEMARALATGPKVLLLDEALAGLNPAEIDDAVRVVRRIHASGVTIVIVEHLLRVVNELATRVVVLDRGRLLADGEPAEVMRDPAVVRTYLGAGHA